MMRTKTLTSLTCSLVLLLFGAISYAAPLNGHPAAYNGWTGVSAYNDGDQLLGTIEYAVFLAADFNNPINGLTGLGYVPDDSLVYTYQVFNTGSDHVSAELVGVNDAFASNIGQFDIGDVAATSMFLGFGVAEWDFLAGNGIESGETSWGLAFSSPNVPMMGATLVLNGGGSALTEVPTPSDIAIPEPSGLLLLSISGGLVMFLRYRWG